MVTVNKNILAINNHARKNFTKQILVLYMVMRKKRADAGSERLMQSAREQPLVVPSDNSECIIRKKLLAWAIVGAMLTFEVGAFWRFDPRATPSQRLISV